ncbi:hypothetical protein [uncultured Desulfovibrio sp.]|uniref:hypothetical protein n=1 Tax=uncultured Desulfovibrio sp. TaxID=167968 RepID=UPI00263105CC|nr:hypothetical protein [uncultured Desulfovibrio sp.]
MRMLIMLTVFLCLAAPVHAVESRTLPLSAAPGYSAGPPAPQVSTPTAGTPAVPLSPQLPELTPSGGVNLDEAWIQNGGARLYWNTLVSPRQIRMGGARFVDPAAVPELLPSGGNKAVRPAQRHVRTKVVVPAKRQKTAQRTPPAGSASTALRPPVAASAVNQPGAGRDKTTPDTAKAGAAASVKQSSPYGGAAPVSAPPVPLPIMPVAPKAPVTPR